jgi:putative tryptophan/tyrosine transport system substrate-binding protein
MRRREFITLIVSASAAWPFAARAQQPATSRIGVLVGFPKGDPWANTLIQALVDGLSQLGWKRDKNMRIDIRWAINPLRMQQLAKELIELQPNLIQVITTPATAAILRETHTIPVVFAGISDPLGSGFVESFARPGGNATGFVNIEDSVAGKWLELLKVLAPQTSRVSILFNPKTAPAAYYLKLLEAAAPSLALKLKALQVSNASEIGGNRPIGAAIERGPRHPTGYVYSGAATTRDDHCAHGPPPDSGGLSRHSLGQRRWPCLLRGRPR